MPVAELKGLPLNLRNRMGKELLEEIEKANYEEGDEIDVAIKRAEAHVAPQVRAQAVARLN